MSYFVLSSEDMDRKPALLTFAYSNQSMYGQKRRWGDIILLSKVNLALIFLLNFLVCAAALGIVLWGALALGIHEWRAQLYSIVLISMLVAMLPNLIRLFNLLRGVGYTSQTQRSIANAMISDAEHNKRAAMERRV